MNIVLFEDGFVTQLLPITYTRTAHDIRCAGFTFVELLSLLYPDAAIASVARSELQFFADQNVRITTTDALDAKDVFFLNARLAPIAPEIQNLIKLLQTSKQKLSYRGCLVGFRGIVEDIDDLDEILRQPLADTQVWDGHVISYPWDVLTLTEGFLRYNLDLLVQRGTQIQEHVFVYGNVKVHPTAQFDTTNGRIVLLDGTTVGAFSVLYGPILLGENSVVSDHAILLGPVSTGAHVKLGGEVEASVLQSYSNKAHAGFLGHSYVGSWVNIGAMATNSDLKNTYGTIKMTLADGTRMDTERQFFGSILGDHAKVSIGTMIMTGKTIGCHAQLAGTIMDDVPSFVRTIGNAYTEIPVEVAEVIDLRMKERRAVEQTEKDRAHIRLVFQQTLEERRRFLDYKLTK